MQTPRTELKAGIAGMTAETGAGPEARNPFALERAGATRPCEAEAIGRALGVRADSLFPELNARAAR